VTSEESVMLRLPVRPSPLIVPHSTHALDGLYVAVLFFNYSVALVDGYVTQWLCFFLLTTFLKNVLVLIAEIHRERADGKRSAVVRCAICSIAISLDC